MHPLSDGHPLTRLFAGLTEYTFISELGLADTKLVDYLADMLTRFIHRDAIYAIKEPSGRSLRDLAEMMIAADRSDAKGEVRREIFRHMGDFALFWTGVYPEAISKHSSAVKAGSLVEITEQGKRSYYLASTYSDTPTQAEEAAVLRRLSDDFDLCAFGLRKVRSHWECGPAKA